jgi:O-antigen/teichoic acid export membrane protein
VVSLSDADAPDLAQPLDRGEISARATRGAISVMARGFGVRVIGMLGNILLARLLLPREFGMISLGNTVIAFGAFLASGGLGATLVREPGTLARRDLQAVFGFQLGITVVVASLVTAVGVPLARLARWRRS